MECVNQRTRLTFLVAVRWLNKTNNGKGIGRLVCRGVN